MYPKISNLGLLCPSLGLKVAKVLQNSQAHLDKRTEQAVSWPDSLADNPLALERRDEAIG